MKSYLLLKCLFAVSILWIVMQLCLAGNDPGLPDGDSCKVEVDRVQHQNKGLLFADSALSDFDETTGQGLITKEVPLTPAAVLEAYEKGIFPWTDLGENAGWYVLKDRGVLDFSDIHIPTSLRKAMKRNETLPDADKNKLIVTFDRAFLEVMRQCAAAERPEGEETWIAQKFIDTYTELHRMGYSHSVEVWRGGTLVGGLYGVHIKGVFSGESMFHHVDNTSKFALLALVDHLRKRGIQWIDTQQVSSFFAQIGAKTIPHAEFLARLTKEHAQPIAFYEPK